MEFNILLPSKRSIEGGRRAPLAPKVTQPNDKKRINFTDNIGQMPQ
jgi:hypothetical protein